MNNQRGGGDFFFKQSTLEPHEHFESPCAKNIYDYFKMYSLKKKKERKQVYLGVT